jgi:hypothetical protein
VSQALALPVQAIAVRLVTFGGQSIEARVYLHAQSGRRSGAETLGERLAASEALFLPCETIEGTQLFNLDHVAYLDCPLGLPDLEMLDDTASFRAAAALELVHGERLRGELRYRLPAFACRVSDLLNAGEERFLLLTTPFRCYYVNRRAVVRVRVEGSPCQ